MRVLGRAIETGYYSPVPAASDIRKECVQKEGPFLERAKEGLGLVCR
jgi:hypothetical protein